MRTKKKIMVAAAMIIFTCAMITVVPVQAHAAESGVADGFRDLRRNWLDYYLSWRLKVAYYRDHSRNCYQPDWQHNYQRYQELLKE